MKKAATLILSIISLLTLLISIITPNAETLGINPEWITIGSTILLAIVQFIEKSGMLTATEAAQMVDEKTPPDEPFTKADVRIWQSENKQSSIK